MKYIALLLAVLLGCAATATITPADTLPTFDATKPIERAIHSTVMLQTPAGRTFCSGTIVKGTEHILTAAHCVDDGDDFVLVGLHGRYAADVVFLDELNDIALLRPPRGTLRPRDGVPLAGAPGRMGDHVFALGHARGDAFPFTLTDGIISFAHRIGDDGAHYVQGTPELVPGMSGGGFYNDRGQLLGANLFHFLAPTYCQFPPCGIYQDSPMRGFSYLPLIKDALARAK